MRMRTLAHRSVWSVLWVMLLLCHAGRGAAQQDVSATARDILQTTGITGGLVVQIGCGDGRLTAALKAGPGYLVQAFDTDPAAVKAARDTIRTAGLYGRVSVDRFDGRRLPLIDNLANLVVAEELGQVPLTEVARVLCPGGVAYVQQAGRWTKTVKPRPAEIDDWTHYMHDASGNAVAQDTVVGPPKRLQWTGSPRYARHHDRMSSVSAVVSAGGRVFYIFDEASPVSILVPSQWKLIARDAFNGTILWKRSIDKWYTQFWPLKSGPAQLPRRLVAVGDRVYTTLMLDGPLVALDAATGETVRTYEGTRATEELILHDGVLLALVNDAKNKPDYDGSARIRQGYTAKFWDERKRRIAAIRADSGEVLWTSRRRVLPATLAANSRFAIFHDGESVVCLDFASGKELWRSEPVPRSREIRSFFLPTLVLYKDVVLFSGGETAGLQTGTWYTSGKDTLTALSAETGKVLWSAYHPPSGYRSPEDLFVVGGLVWTGETTSGRAVGVFTGRDVHTGKIVKEFAPDVDIYWFHHRCYRGKATEKYLLMARAGTEFVDLRREHWIPHHWFRGACLYGVMPANGLIYAPQHPCACYLEAKLSGFNALAPTAAGPRVPENIASETRLEKGPAFDAAPVPLSALGSPLSSDWPTLRHDGTRSGYTKTPVRSTVKPAWKTALGGKLTSPVIADGRVFVAQVDSHAVHALDAGSGEPLWQFTAGGRVDSPPTVYRGLVLFGCADGYVYALRADDGAMAWRLRAAPIDQRLTSFEQLESVWPVHGSVLVQDGVLYCVAGRSMFLDGGLRLLRLDPTTGRLLSETVLDDRESGTGKEIQEFVSWLNMPTALPDVLSSDGRFVYMRSQPFTLDGTRLPLAAMPTTGDPNEGAPPATQNPEYAHLFSPTGLLDNAWWHRSYWLYGSRFISGWNGYFLSGRAVPSGKILVFDEQRVYGFGRKPRYYRWTTQIEHQLFAADKQLPTVEKTPGLIGDGGSRIRIAKSASLDPTGKPLTVQACIKSERPGGVILARGGGVQGFAIYLHRGRPTFAVRSGSGDKAMVAISAKTTVGKRWTHLAAVLTADKKMQLYVDGRLAASGTAADLLSIDPQEAMEIGADEGSCVGDYDGPNGFTGLVDNVMLHFKALDAETIAQHAAGTAAGTAGSDADKLVLAFSFDTAKAVDESGNGNHGTVEGVSPVKGRTGRAMKFVAASNRPTGYLVKHHWTGDLPIFARAMVLADKTLFVAGPVDILDEELAVRQLDDPATAAKLADQAAALAGKKGSWLLAVSATDGKQQAKLPLEAPPVFDGMAAASGRLYISTTDGKVVCLGKE